ncbi:hypothetical protein [Actinoallomurus sp. NPDC052274]|uniref:hypothetical protein n=1 Tax=Actinoallomurus sp. NPDC052274 TaxID=3155420 RepID=UPI003418CA6F
MAFFDGARTGGPLGALLVWSVAGLLLLGLGALRDRRAGSRRDAGRTAPTLVDADT